MSEIKLTPLGAGQDVGRSCIMLSIGGKNVMLDCGMHMGYNDERKFPDFSFIATGALTEHVDCVIISHFHLDHCGALPYMSEIVGYNGPIYMTHPTKAIAPILLEDMRKLVVERKGEPNFFTSQNIKDCMKKVIAVSLHQSVQVDAELEIKAYYAGHVLGAAMFHVKVGEQSIVYTGDYNMTPDRHLGAAWIDRCRPDVLISEATYATTIRDSKRCRERDFLKKVHDCVERGGKVLIPVFALGRAQELCILLDTYWERMNLKAPIYFAAGLTEKANHYYKMFVTWTNQKIRSTFVQRNMFDFRHIRPFDKSMADAPGPMVVFATPGMLHAGLSLTLFRKWAPFEQNMVILPGYCVSGTVGHKLLGGAKRVEVDASRVPIDVRMSVEYLSFSAHADAKGIMQLVRSCQPRAVMLVHGEAAKMAFLRKKVEQECHVPCAMPANGETAVFASASTPDAVAPIPLQASVSLLKREQKAYDQLPPAPKRPRPLHGVLVVTESGMRLTESEEACAEAGITPHQVRFTSTLTLRDAGPATVTLERIHRLLHREGLTCSVQQAEGSISVEDLVLVKVVQPISYGDEVEEIEDDSEEHMRNVLVSWDVQDEKLGGHIISLLQQQLGAC